MIGTPAYMPPEQAMGELSEVDEQSDVYSLGAILYEIIAARAPYEGKSANQILGKVQNVAPDPLPNAAPPDLRALVEKALARAKADRLPSAAALCDEVRAFREGRPLSVYRYSRAEKARKFVARNKVASAVSALALVAIVAVTAIAFVNVLNERDDAKQALARAEKAEHERVALEQSQRAEHSRLVGERNRLVEAQREKLATLELGRAAEGVRKRIEQFKGLASLSGVLPEELAKNRTLVGELLALCAARSEYLRLLTEPIAGLPPKFVGADEIARLRQVLSDERLMAATLSRLSEDFALAQVILDETVAPDERFAQERARLQEDRGAQLKRHADLIIATLTRVRTDRATNSALDADFDELVMRLSLLRERQTVDLLLLSLETLTKKALSRESQLLWTQPERDEITLLCRVLANMEMPDLTVEPLAEFIDATDDERLAIEAAQRRNDRRTKLLFEYTMLRCARLAGRWEDALGKTEECIKTAKELGDGKTCNSLLYFQSVLLSDLGRYDESLRALKRAREHAEGLGDPYLIAVLTGSEGMMLRDIGQSASGEPLLRSAVQYFSSTGYKRMESSFLAGLASVLINLKRYPEARQAAEAAQRIAADAGNLRELHAAQGMIGFAQFLTRQFQEALATMDTASATARAANDVVYAETWAGHSGLALLALGKQELSLARIREAISALVAMGRSESAQLLIKQLQGHALELNLDLPLSNLPGTLA